MSFEQVVFILVAAGTLGAALLVVTTRNLIHAALWLIAALFGVAILFVFLNAGFFCNRFIHIFTWGVHFNSFYIC